MSFYNQYSRFIRSFIEQLEFKDIPEIRHLSSLLSAKHFTHPLSMDDVEQILNELHIIHHYLMANGQDKQQLLIAFNTLTKSLVDNVVQLSHSSSVEPLMMERWLKADMPIGKCLLDGMGKKEWYERELRDYPERYEMFPLKVSKVGISSILLNRLLVMGVLPDKSWYLSIPELKAYQSAQDVLGLAYSKISLFDELDRKYPGFYIHMITSYELLKTFCQLLPDSYHYLLFAPQLQPYIQDASHFVSILESMEAISRPTRLKLAKNYISTLDDLVKVISAYPSYMVLIAKSVNTSSGVVEYKEGSFADLIQTLDDLLRFDLTNPLMLKIINGVPRFKSLIADPQALCAEVKRQTEEFIPPSLLKREQQGSAGFFSSVTACDSRLLSLGAAINIMQFQEQAGYYTNGNIAFTKENQYGHFGTEASDGYILALALSHRAFELWQQAPEVHKRCFEIMEAGGGEGDLCFKMLHFIASMAKTDPAWNEFYNSVHYTIIEISSELARRQNDKLRALIAQQKVEVLVDDAMSMTKYKKVAALHVSNELMDMLPSEQIYIDHNKQVQLMMVMPILLPSAYEYLQRDYPDCLAGFKDELHAFAQYVRANAIQSCQEGYPLTREWFKRIVAITASRGFAGPTNAIVFHKYKLPVHLFPEVREFIIHNDDVLLGLRPGDTKIISPALCRYAKLITEKALVSIVIDYGETTFTLKNIDYRGYGDDSCLFMNLPLARPGKNDITYDVDFTVLIRQMRRASPHGQSMMVLMSRLYPNKTMIISKEYEQLVSLEDVKKFKESKFVMALFISPLCSSQLKDVCAHANLAVTKEEHMAWLLKLTEVISTNTHSGTGPTNRLLTSQ